LPFYTRLSDNNHLAAIFLTARSGPNQSATRHLIQHIDDQLHHWLPGMRSGVGGPTALMDGFTHLTDARLPWMLGGVATVAIIVLFAATGSWWLALLGVVFDGLVTLATAGILVATVQHGLFGLEPEALASAVTPLVFVLLFGLSMDYEVILLHRIQEVWRQGHSVGDAVSHGLTHTGGMITGAGMIMVVAFLAMLISPLEIMQTLAIGLTTAILLDTWIVRSMLVPGSITVLGRYAFWPARRPFPLHVPSPQQKD
jgi:RND superfamily putative drug exporter